MLGMSEEEPAQIFIFVYFVPCEWKFFLCFKILKNIKSKAIIIKLSSIQCEPLQGIITHAHNILWNVLYMYAIRLLKCVSSYLHILDGFFYPDVVKYKKMCRKAKYKEYKVHSDLHVHTKVVTVDILISC